MRWIQRFYWFACVLLCVWPTDNVFGQNPQPLAKPQDLGLLIPRGKTAVEVTGRNVLLPAESAGIATPPELQANLRSDSAGKLTAPEVARVYLEIGDRYVVLTSDGSLRSVLKRETTATERPFKPASKDDLAKQLKQQFRGFKTRATKRYLCVYNTTDSFCESKTAILETMYPMLSAYFRRQKLPVTSPSTPLIVVMFRTKAEFLKYRQMPDSLLAYYNGVNNRVFLYQFSDATTDAPLIAIKQSTSTIAHEGVHQILHNIGVQKRLAAWPIWVSEGLAEYFAPTTTNRSKWKGVGKPNDLRMRELFKHFNSVRGLGSGNLIQDVVSAKRLNSTEYAIVWALTHYLATKRKKDLFEYLREVSKITAFEEPEDELGRFMRYFGGNLAKIEREMIKHIRALPYTDPVANQPYFLISAISGNKRYGIITSSLDHAKTQRQLLKQMTPAHRVNTRFLQPKGFRNRKLATQALSLFTRKK